MNRDLWVGRLLVVLGVALPFDSVRPLFGFRVLDVAVEFSLLELLVLPFVLLSLPTLFRELRRRIEFGRGRFGLGVSLLWIICALLSASLAEVFRMEAFRYASRLALFLLLFWSIRAWLGSDARLGSTRLLRGLLLGSLLSSGIGLLDWFWPETMAPLLDFFRFAPSHAAGIARMSATFPYATIAAIHFELLVPLGLVVALRDRSRFWRRLGWLVTSASLLVTVFSWTRSGMVALGIVLPLALVVAAVSPRLTGWIRPLSASIVGLCAAVALLIFATQEASLRLRTESDLNWVGAGYRVPEAITGPVSGQVTTRVVVQNTGERVWKPEGRPITRLEGRWLSEDQEWVLDESDLGVSPLRFALAREVEPGDTTSISVEFGLPTLPGNYAISWGLALEDLYAFRHRGIREEVSLVTVRSDPNQDGAEGRSVRRSRAGFDRPAHAWNVPRRDLWYAALEFFRERPVLGIGPGTFRFRYGEPLGVEHVDERVHPNNLYLQLLAEQGWVGLALFVLFLLTIVVESQFWRDSVRFAAAVAVAIFLVHSLADGFMSFVSGYTLFAMCLALLSAGGSDPDRTVLTEHFPEPRPRG